MYFTGNVRWVPRVQRFIEISSLLSLNSSSKSRMGENKTEANARLIVLLLSKDKKNPGRTNVINATSIGLKSSLKGPTDHNKGNKTLAGH